MQIVLAWAFFLIFTPLCFGLSIMGIALNPHNWKRYLPLMILSIGIVVYAYNPSAESDLTRYFMFAEECSRANLFDAFDYFGQYWNFDRGLWVIIVEFWLLGKADVVHLIPMISTMTVYGISFYITCDTAGNYKAERYIPIVVLFQSCILPFVSIITNVRNVWAFSIIILACYLELVKKKRNLLVLALYVLPCFIHSSAAILILLRLAISLSNKIKIPFLAIIALFPQIMEILHQNAERFTSLGSIGLIIQNAINKGYWYLTHGDTDEWALHVAASKYQQINRGFLIILAIMICILIIWYMNKITNEDYVQFMNFIFLLSLMTLVFIWFVINHLWRFSAASFIGIGVIAIPILKKKKDIPLWVSVIIKIMPLFMLMGAALQLWGNQYAVNYIDWGANTFLTNIYTIIFDILKGIF